MTTNVDTARWHWNPAVVCSFFVLLLLTASWPLWARGEEPAASAGSTEASGEHAAADQAAPPASGTKELIPQRNLMSILKGGGMMMIPIALCSFIMLLFTFERFISLRRRRIISKPFVRQFLHQVCEGQVDRDEALALCEKSRSVVAEVFAAAVRKWGRPAVEVEQAILDAGERAANRMRRNLRVLSSIATVGPLLGLLGTVLGMITSFHEIAMSDGAGRAEQLAAGISEALMSTAGGLMVAIPAFFSYTFFVGRVDRLVMEIDELGQQVVAAISAEALADGANRARGRKKAA